MWSIWQVSSAAALLTSALLGNALGPEMPKGNEKKRKSESAREKQKNKDAV